MLVKNNPIELNNIKSLVSDKKEANELASLNES
jgi:hypothetical protein